MLNLDGVAADQAGNIFITDESNFRVRNVLLASPAVNSGGVVPAAGFQPGPVAVSSIISLFGRNLAPYDNLATTQPLPARLGGLRLLIGNQEAPLFFAGPTQVNAQVPFGVPAEQDVQMVVEMYGMVSSPTTVHIAASRPGLFTLGPPFGSQGPILIANTDTIAGPNGSVPGRTTRPAMRGEYVSIYSTGLGDVTNRPAVGAAASDDPLSFTLATPTVTIGGVPAIVTFSGLAPGFVGLYQADVLIPQNTSVGSAVPVVMSIGGLAALSPTPSRWLFNSRSFAEL